MTPISQAARALIIPEMTATSKKEALKELAAAARTAHPHLDPDYLYSILEAREELGSTGIGEGAAIPHGKVAGLEEMVLVCGRSVKGVAFAAQDGRPVHLFFLLLAPANSASPYLEHLAQLARFLQDHQTMARLLQAENREEMAAILGGNGGEGASDH
ncbi:MAG TPA: PTS sugar transporter subunit IIA [Desulfurivibrio alkaliphilus]|uniref:PTS sugar transporter subunit IIA n=1 Tax=Desulfurivibrio alkaliphilus TaxID=427923 RepID=A0A7C2XGR8_9BACT|nr:PTS sugar transporter subunit IIA [Desulfurivibrio alkaliphilus]